MNKNALKPHRERIVASGGGNSQLVASLLAYLKFGKVGKVLRRSFGLRPQDDRKPVMLSDSETSQCRYNLRGSFGLRPQDDQNQQYAVILSDSEESHILRPQNERKPLSLTLSLGERTFDDISRNLTISNLRKFLIFLFPSPLFPSKNKKAAFTLAEVLITLGIIGVVAAITMPTLIKNYQKQVYVAQLKKTYTTLSQGFQKYLADNGTDNLTNTELTYPAIYEEHGSIYTYTAINQEKFDEFMSNYFKVVKTCVGSECDYSNYNTAKYGSPQIFGYRDDDCTSYFLADGAIVQLASSVLSADINVDVNGKKGPNKYGRDIFRFKLEEKKFRPWAENEAYPDGSCAGSNPDLNWGGWACAERIMQDGWKMNY
jgi:prepilin-type N-terminal cleavage/methylation domain-containing protein